MFLENSCCEPSRGDRKLPRRFNSVSAPWLCFLILSAEKSQCVYFQPSQTSLSGRYSDTDAWSRVSSSISTHKLSADCLMPSWPLSLDGDFHSWHLRRRWRLPSRLGFPLQALVSDEALDSGELEKTGRPTPTSLRLLFYSIALLLNYQVNLSKAL